MALSSSFLKIARTAPLLVASLAILGGCSWLSDWPTKGSSRSDEALAPPPPQAKIVKTVDATWIDPRDNTAPQAEMIPPSTWEQKDAMGRLDELEKQVRSLSEDMSMLRPALTRLLDTQESLHKLIETKAAEGAGAPAPALAPAISSPAKAPAQAPNAGAMNDPHEEEIEAAMEPQELVPAKEEKIPAKPAAGKSSSATQIKEIRIGEHSDKTRLVLEVTNKTEFQIDIDNGEKIMVVDLPNAAAEAATAQVRKSSLISSYNIMDNGQGGSRLVVQLKKAAQVKSTQTLPATGKQPVRLVIDVAGS